MNTCIDNGWLIISEDEGSFKGEGGLFQLLSRLMISKLIKPLDTEHNRLIGHFGNEENDKIAIRVSTGLGQHESREYFFCKREEIKSIIGFLKDQLLK